MKFLKGFGRLMIFSIILFIIGCSAGETDEPTAGAEEGEVKTGGALNIGYSTQPNSLDPHLSSESANTIVTRNIFETLVVKDSNEAVQPMLAESFEQSEDGKTLTFVLREGVYFHNGKEMKAGDVVASMNNWLKNSSSGKAFDEAVFEEIDEYTVQITLDNPLSTALVSLSRVHNYPAIMPEEVINEAGEEGIKEYIGTGPFKYEEWRQDQYLKLVKNEDYQSRSEPADGLAGKKEALVDELYFHFVSDTFTRVAGLQSGEYDLIHSIPADSVNQIEDEPNSSTIIELSGSLNVHFNKKNSIFKDLKMREIVEMALDKEAILTATYADEKFYEMNHNFMMKYQTQQWNSSIGEEEYMGWDAEKAKKMLEESDYDGEQLTLLTTRDYPDQYEASIVVQRQLEEIGMNIDLAVYDWPTFLDYRDNEDAWDIFTVVNTAVPEPLTTNYLNNSYAGWTDSPELDELKEEFESQTSLEEAEAYFDHLQQWFVDYKPIVKIGESNNIHGVNDNVHGLEFYRGFVLWNVYKED